MGTSLDAGIVFAAAIYTGVFLDSVPYGIAWLLRLSPQAAAQFYAFSSGVGAGVGGVFGYKAGQATDRDYKEFQALRKEQAQLAQAELTDQLVEVEKSKRDFEEVCFYNSVDPKPELDAAFIEDKKDYTQRLQKILTDFRGFLRPQKQIQFTEDLRSLNSNSFDCVSTWVKTHPTDAHYLTPR